MSRLSAMPSDEMQNYLEELRRRQAMGPMAPMGQSPDASPDFSVPKMQFDPSSAGSLEARSVGSEYPLEQSGSNGPASTMRKMLQMANHFATGREYDQGGNVTLEPGNPFAGTSPYNPQMQMRSANGQLPSLQLAHSLQAQHPSQEAPLNFQTGATPDQVARILQHNSAEPDAGSTPINGQSALFAGAAGGAAASQFATPPSPYGPLPYAGAQDNLMGPHEAPFQSSIRNAQGDLLSRMSYAANSDGTYGAGQLTDRKAGYGFKGDYQPAISNGVESARGPLTVQDMFRDSLERNKADRTGSLFGEAMNPQLAMALTNSEMKPIISDRELQAHALEGQLNRQNTMDIANANIEAGKYQHKNQLDRETQSSINKGYAEGRGEEINRVMTELHGPKWKDKLFGAMPGDTSASGAPATPAATPGAPAPISSQQKLLSFVQGLTDIVPSTTKYRGVVGGKPIEMAGTASKFDPGEFVNRYAGSQFTPEETDSLMATINRMEGGAGLRKSLLGHAIGSQLPYDIAPNDDYATAAKRSALSAAFTPMIGLREQNYPQSVTNYAGVPGLNLQAPEYGNRFAAGMGNVMNLLGQRGMPSYMANLPGGEQIPVNMSGSYGPMVDAFGQQGAINSRAAQNRSATMMLIDRLARQR